MLSKAMQDAINEQINAEYYSAYLYLAMAAYFESASLPGFANWMRMQNLEETFHGNKFFDHVHERGGQVALKAIDQPTLDFESPLDVFTKTLEHEQHVTSLINKLYALAQKENDYASQVMLQWFIEEQVEEEDAAGKILDMLKMIGDSPHALVMLDKELGARAAPAPAGEESA